MESSGASDSWRLELVEIEGKESDGITFIVDTCRDLKSTLMDLSTRFFGLCDSENHRLIDFCVPALNIFNMELASALLNGCFIPNLPDALINNVENIVESREDEVSNLNLATRAAISPVMSTAQELGYFQPNAVECLANFLSNLGRLTVERQDQTYVLALITILEDYSNFVDLIKVGGGAIEEEASKENIGARSTEGELEDAVLAKLFHNVHLEFPVCYVRHLALPSERL